MIENEKKRVFCFTLFQNFAKQNSTTTVVKRKAQEFQQENWCLGIDFITADFHQKYQNYGIGLGSDKNKQAATNCIMSNKSVANEIKL